MSEIKALEDLRKWAQRVIESCCTGMKADEVLESADEIQAEIDERFMELPVDADGVPWTLETESFVDDTGAKVMFSGLQVDCKGRWKILSNCVWHDPSLCRHIKPDPLKELLTEMLDRNSDGIGYRDFNCDFNVFVGHYADKIRELMKEDGE